jgi:hypothetical protein
MENKLECLSLANFKASLLLDNMAETCPSVVPFSTKGRDMTLAIS